MAPQERVYCPACYRSITAGNLGGHMDSKAHALAVARMKKDFFYENDAEYREEWRRFQQKCGEINPWRPANNQPDLSNIEKNYTAIVPTSTSSGPGHCPICRQDGVQYVNFAKHLHSEVHARKLAIAHRTLMWADVETKLDWIRFLQKYRELAWWNEQHKEAVKLAVACANIKEENILRILHCAGEIGFEFGNQAKRKEAVQKVVEKAKAAEARRSMAIYENFSYDSEESSEESDSESYASSSEYSDSQDSVKDYFYRAMGSKACYYLDPGDEDYMYRNESDADDEEDEESSEGSEDEFEDEEDYPEDVEESFAHEGDSIAESDQSVMIIKWETAKKAPFQMERGRPRSLSWNVAKD